MKFIAAIFALLFCSSSFAMTINGQLKSAQLETLSADPTSSTARVYYNTTINGAKIYNGTEWTSLGGAGGGEKNYIVNGSSSATGWAASSSAVTVTTDTNAADLPDVSAGSALLVTGVLGSTSYGFYNFTIDPADYNKKLKVQFDQACGLSGAATPISNCANSDFAVEVDSCTVAWSGSPATTCSGTSARLSLSTDSSAISALPALTGTYRTAFDSPGSAAKFLQLRVGMNATQTHAIALANIVVGPGTVTQGAAVSGWTSYTPTVGNVTTSASSASYRRIGDAMEISGSYTASGQPTATVSFSLPSGFTINTSALSGSSSLIPLGHGWLDPHSGNFWTFEVISLSSTTMYFMVSNTGNFINATTPLTGASGDVLLFRAMVPVNEWAGSGTVNVVQNDCEYVSNSSTSDADDSTSFAYGPNGSTTPAAQTSGRTRRVRFLHPISPTDKIEIEIDDANVGIWTPVASINNGSWAFQSQNGVNYGIWLVANVNITDIGVEFGQYSRATGATYGAAGTAWSTGLGFWRVKKCAAGQAVGFGSVTQNASGLVQAAGQLLGTNTNDDAIAGNVGQTLTEQNRPTPITANYVTSTGIALTGGDWGVTICFSGVGAASTTSMIFGLSNITANPTSTTFADIADSPMNYITALVTSAGGSGCLAEYRVTVAAGTTATYGMKYKAVGANFSGALDSYSIARRRR